MAVWTGTRMIVWGGGAVLLTNTGGVYDPVARNWVGTSTGANVPPGTYRQPGVGPGTSSSYGATALVPGRA